MKVFVVLALVGAALAAPQMKRMDEQLMHHEDQLDVPRHESARAYGYGGPGAFAISGPSGAIAAPAISAGPGIVAGPAFASAPAAISLSAPQAIGPAVGVFPNAKVGGCAIPLLLSCSPSVVSGHVAHSSSSYASAPAYRDQEATNAHKMREAPEKAWAPNTHVQLAAADFHGAENIHHHLKMDN